MCAGIAIAKDSVSDWLLETLQERVATREGVAELRFHYRDRAPLLPVWRESEFLILPWGNRDDKQSRLPKTGWARTESVEAGKWQYLRPEAVEIPALFGLERGVWFHIPEGLKGILVHDEARRPHVYLLTQSASHYYQVMTRHDRMPVFVGEQM